MKTSDRVDVHADQGGNTACTLRAGGRERLPRAGASTRAGRCAGVYPGRSPVPALFGGRSPVTIVMSTFSCRSPGGAGRPGVQELDLDRRVRQADARGGTAGLRGDAGGVPAPVRPILMTSFAFIFGVLPWSWPRCRRGDAQVAGNRRVQRHARVTLFGIFLTPVFFSVIQGSARRGCSLAAPRAGWLDPGRAIAGSRSVTSSVAWRGPPAWAPGIGAGAGSLAGLDSRDPAAERSSPGPLDSRSASGGSLSGGDPQP